MLHHLRIRAPLAFGLAIFVVGVFVSEYWKLYDRIPYFDKVLHVLGGIAVAWMALALLQEHVIRMTWPKQLFVIVSVAALVGVFWEFAEYTSTLTYFHGGDLADTLGDLASDIAGGTLFALWALWKER